MTIKDWIMVFVYFAVFITIIVYCVRTIKYYRNNPLSTDVPQVPKSTKKRKRKKNKLV